MSNQPPYRKPTSQSRYGNKSQMPNMATPRRPEPPKKGGVLGFIFILGILGGGVWLLMAIFGWGPYQSAGLANTPTSTGTQFTFVLPTNTGAGPTPGAETDLPTQAVRPTSTDTPVPELFPFILDGQPEAITSDLIRPELGCDYLIIAGQVWDLQGAPVLESAQVHLYGQLGGFDVDAISEPGSALVYGQSGYEFILKGLVLDSQKALSIRLEDVDGNLLSSPYFVQTYQDCQRNLILINFKKVR